MESLAGKVTIREAAPEVRLGRLFKSMAAQMKYHSWLAYHDGSRSQMLQIAVRGAWEFLALPFARICRA